MPLITFDESLYRITGIPEDKDEIGFDVYENYLSNIIELIQSTYKDRFLLDIIKNTKNIKQNTSISPDYLKRFLFLGWNTECLVRINDVRSDIELLRVNNQWKPIQVYYSIYSLCEASNYSLTLQKLESHSKCLRQMSEYFERTSFRPWNYSFKGCSGNKRTPAAILPINFNKSLSVPNSLKRQGITPEEVLACCLKAEHNNRIDDYKPKKGQTLKYLYDPKNTSILHFLYRLRIKSNYKNVGVFLANAPDEKIVSFSKNLTLICSYTNALNEIIIARKIGKTLMLKIMNEFIKKHQNTTPIDKRLKIYNSLLV